MTALVLSKAPAEAPTALGIGEEERPPVAVEPGRVAPRSLVFAIAAHLAVAALILLLSQLPPARERAEPPPIEVALVLEKPPAPAPKPPPQPERYRSSGPGETTVREGEKQDRPGAAAGREAPTPSLTSPPPAEPVTGPEASPREAEETPPFPAPSAVPMPQAKPAPPAPTTTAAARPPAPSPERARMPPARGGASTGDRYLNSILAAVEQHRMYPRQARALDLGGIAIYAIAINRWGKILSIDLRQSSGASLLDETGAEMIRRSDPLPPVPPDIHGDVIRLTMHLPIYPP